MLTWPLSRPGVLDNKILFSNILFRLNYFKLISKNKIFIMIFFHFSKLFAVNKWKNIITSIVTLKNKV